MDSLRKKFLYQSAVSFIYSVAPIIVFPYVSRTLGPDKIGRINFVDYAAQLFILFASFGIPLYAVREIAKSRNEKVKVERLSSSLLSIHFLFSGVSLLGFGCAVFFFPPEFRHTGLLVLTAANILLNALSIEWLVQALEEFAFLSKRSVFFKLASIAAIFLFIREEADFVWYYFLLIFFNACILIADIVFIYRKGYRFHFTSAVREHFKPLAVFFLMSATISIYSYFDTVILGLVAGSVAVGFYTTALKTVRFTQNLVNDAGGVLLPRMSFLIAQNDNNEISRIMNLSLQFTLTISIPLVFFIFWQAPVIIQVLAGSEFTASVPVLKILSFLPLLIGLSNLFGTQILLSYGEEKTVLTGVVAGSITSIAANILLCPLYKEQGAALACMLAEAVVTAILWWKAVKYVRFSLAKFFLPSLFVSCAVFYPVIYLLQRAALHPLVQVLLTAAICFSIYAALQLLLFKNYIIKTVADSVISRLTPRKSSH